MSADCLIEENTNYEWVPSSVYGKLPPNSIYAGNDLDGEPIYVGRAFHECEQMPAKVIPGRKIAFISHNGLEHIKHHYEVLTGFGLTWVPSSSGDVPPNAVPGGIKLNGEELYIGRSRYEDSLTPGKIHNGRIYFPYADAEHNSTEYDVLISAQTAGLRTPHKNGQIPTDAIFGGYETDNSVSYIGRAYHKGDELPAKVIPSKQIAYVSYNGDGISTPNYELLCEKNVRWVRSSHGLVPSDAVIGGRTKIGEALYIGRVQYEGCLIPGKIHPVNECVYIAYDGQEIGFREYEILIKSVNP